MLGPPLASRAPMDLPPSALPLAADAKLVRDATGRHRATYRTTIPYFGWLWRPLLARRARRVERAADAGLPLPDGVPWWAPPTPQPAQATAAVASLCLLSLVLSYGGALLTQTLPYAAEVYDVGDSELGVGLAIVRVGVLVALLFGAFADRAGRRRFVLVAAIGHCAVAAVIGLAPTFEAYVGFHIGLRALDAALNVAIVVLALESVPAGNRAITLSLIFLSGGAGVGLAILALPLAATGAGGLAAVYALQLLAVPLVLHAGRRLPESARFLRHAAESHGYGELLRGEHSRRLALVGLTIFLSAVFFAPLVQFFNRYLDDVHGYSALEIVVFQAVTGLPSVPFLVLGGRLADRHGRKRIGVPVGVLAVLVYAAVFLTASTALWVLSIVGNMLLAMSGVALAVYGPELFPTRIRSAANTALAALGVVGSALGLVVAGTLGDAVGIGEAIALLAVFPLVSLTIVALRFPETAGRELEETSGEVVAVPLR